MQRNFRSILILLAALPIVAGLGILVGQGDFIAPIALSGVLLLLALRQLFFRELLYEALLLSFLIFGYIVGNRGFAQISLCGRPADLSW